MYKRQVYKLVSREDDGGVMVDVAKASARKRSVGGRKHAVRRIADGAATAELVGIGEQPAGDGDDRELLIPLVLAGEVVAPTGATGLEAARTRHATSRAELPAGALRLSAGEPAIPTLFIDELPASAQALGKELQA